MVIHSLKVSGFRYLYDVIKSSKNETRVTPMFIADFLNHCMITVDVSDLTSLEVFVMKMWVSNMRIVHSYYRNFLNEKTFQDKKEFERINTTVEDLLSLHDTILNDEDLNPQERLEDVDKILPIGCRKYRVIVTFERNNILNLLGNVYIENLFKDQETKKFYTHFPDYVTLENSLANIFYMSFYKFLNSTVSNQNDLALNQLLEKKLYPYAEDECTLSSYNSINGELTFFNTSVDEMNHQLYCRKSSLEKTPFVLQDLDFCIFIMNTSFQEFFSVFTELNTGVVLDYQPFKLKFLDNEIFLHDSTRKKYQYRISDSFDKICEFKANIAQKQFTDLNLLNFIFFGNNMKFSYKLRVNEFDTLEKELEYSTSHSMKKIIPYREIINAQFYQ